jgi:hypothetical protein
MRKKVDFIGLRNFMPAFVSWICMLYSLPWGSCKMSLSGNIKQSTAICRVRGTFHSWQPRCPQENEGHRWAVSSFHENKRKESYKKSLLRQQLCYIFVVTYKYVLGRVWTAIHVTWLRRLLPDVREKTKYVNWQWEASTEQHFLNSWGKPDNSVSRANKLGYVRSRNFDLWQSWEAVLVSVASIHILGPS